MAKHAKRRKSAGKKTHHRRRRVGAVALNAKSPIVQFGSIAAGFLLGTQIDTMLTKVIPSNVDGKLVAAGEVGIGYMLSFGGKGGTKKLLPTVAGGLMIGAGIKKAITAFGIGGFQMVPAVGGYRSVTAIGAPPKRLSGYNAGRNGLNGYSTFRNGTIDGGLMANEMMNR